MLAVGKRFSDFAAFKSAVEEHGKATNAVFTTADSKASKYLKLGCKHHGKPRVSSQGIRPNQKSFKISCPAFFYAKQYDGCVVVTSSHVEHNHVLDAAKVKHYPETKRLAKEDKEKVEELLSYGIKPSILQERVRALTGKAINTQDLANLRYALRTKNRNGETKLEEALAELAKLLTTDDEAVALVGKKSNGVLEVIDVRDKLKESEEENDVEEEGEHEEGTVEFVFFQTGSMRKNLKDFPEVLLVDSTYNTTDNKMPLTVSMVMDGHGSGRAVSYCFIANETMDTLTAVLKCLVSANPDGMPKTKTVVVDKDLSEIGAVKEVLGPDVSVQICTFHSQKAFKEGTKNIADKVQKEAVRKTLSKLVYSESEESYNKLYEELSRIAPDDFMENYFNKYWHCMPEAWCNYQKLMTVNFNNFTNNRLENHNGKLKELLDSNFSLAESIKGILLLHSNKEFDVSYREFLCTTKISYVVGNMDADVDEMFRQCTPFAAKLMRSEMQRVDLPHTTVAVNDSCTCPFFKMYELPCRHIFFARKEADLPKFDLNNVAERWRINSYVENPPPVGHVVLDLPHAPAALTQKAKFKQANIITTKIADLLASCTSQVFEERMAVLHEVYNNWAQNIPMSLHKNTDGVIQANEPTEALDDNTTPLGDGVVCNCGELVARRTVSNGPKKGRKYYCCARKEDRCQYEKDVLPCFPQFLSSQYAVIPGPMNKLAGSLELPVSVKARGRPKGSKTTVIGTLKEQYTRKQNGGNEIVHRCLCNLEAVERTVSKDSINQGKKFLCCPKDRKNQCSFFRWISQQDTENKEAPGLSGSLTSSELCRTLKIPDVHEFMGGLSDAVIVDLEVAQSPPLSAAPELNFADVATQEYEDEFFDLNKNDKSRSEKESENDGGCEAQRRKEGAAIPDRHFLDMGFGRWAVKSQTNGRDYYTVSKIGETFTCTCTAEFKPCKHIFKVIDRTQGKVFSWHALANQKERPTAGSAVGSVRSISKSFTDESMNHTRPSTAGSATKSTSKCLTGESMNRTFTPSKPKEYRCKAGCKNLLERRICAGIKNPKNIGRAYYACASMSQPGCRGFVFWEKSNTSKTTIQDADKGDDEDHGSIAASTFSEDWTCTEIEEMLSSVMDDVDNLHDTATERQADDEEWRRRHVTIRKQATPQIDIICISSDSDTENEFIEIPPVKKEPFSTTEMEANGVLSSTLQEINPVNQSGMVVLNVIKENPLGLLVYDNSSEEEGGETVTASNSDDEIEKSGKRTCTQSSARTPRPKRVCVLPTRLAKSYEMDSLELTD